HRHIDDVVLAGMRQEMIGRSEAEGRKGTAEAVLSADDIEASGLQAVDGGLVAASSLGGSHGISLFRFLVRVSAFLYKGPPPVDQRLAEKLFEEDFGMESERAMQTSASPFWLKFFPFTCRRSGRHTHDRNRSRHRRRRSVHRPTCLPLPGLCPGGCPPRRV